MTAPTSHDRYEELVAGLALSALEPEDEQVVLRHLPSCAACERDLAAHRDTLSHLAYLAPAAAPPPALWEGIRSRVEAVSGPGAFTPVAVPVTEAPPAPVVDLAQVRARRPVRRVAAWASVAAAVAVVATLGTGVVRMQRTQNEQGALSQRLSAAVRAVETAPGRTVPLKGADGQVTAVAVLQADKLSLIVDGLARNDASSSIYVLWGQARTDQPAIALASFDVRDGALDVVRDLTVGPEDEAPQLFVITREPGRSAPAVSQQPALATGRVA